MRILAVDSSAKACYVALTDDKKIIGSFFINTALTHSQTLVPMIDALLKNTAVSLDSVDVLAVSVGPGSFTGVRIGVAAVKGIAMPLNKKCAAVSTLEAMAHNYVGEDCIVCAAMDARRNQVYNALFRVENGEISRICDDRALSVDDLGEYLKFIDERIVLVGDGAELCYNSYKEILSNVELAPEHIRFQNASGVAMVALNGDYISSEELMPTYLRLPQAERELKKRMENEK